MPRNTSDNLRGGFGGDTGTATTGFTSLIGLDVAASIGLEIVGFTGDFVGFGGGDKDFEDLGFTRGSDGFGSVPRLDLGWDYWLGYYWLGLLPGLGASGFIGSVWEDSESTSCLTHRICLLDYRIFGWCFSMTGS